MVILMFFSAAFCLISLIMHSASLFGFNYSSKELMMIVGYFSILALGYPAAHICTKTTRGLDKSDIRKIVNVIPFWLYLILGFAIIYAVGNAAYYVIFVKSMDLAVDKDAYLMNAKTKVLYSLWFLMHYFIFLMLYTCRYIKKHGHHLLDTERQKD